MKSFSWPAIYTRSNVARPIMLLPAWYNFFGLLPHNVMRRLHYSAGMTRMYDEQRLRRTCSSYMRDIHVSRTFVGGAYGRLFAGFVPRIMLSLASMLFIHARSTFTR